MQNGSLGAPLVTGWDCPRFYRRGLASLHPLI